MLNKILHLGIHDGLTFEYRNKVKIFNTACFVILLISISYCIFGLINHLYMASLVTLVSVACLLIVFYFIYLKKYVLAFNFAMIYGFVFLSSFTFLFGAANKSYFYFLFMPVASSITFETNKTTIKYFIASVVLMLINILFTENMAPYYHIEAVWLKYFGYPNIVFTAFLIFLGVRLFKQENKKYARKIEDQNKSLEEKNKEITDSINYAQKIQHALFPKEQEFKACFEDSFILLKPKDIVSGDFYWITEKKDKVYYATADCTGHGVPGGFMTMLGISFLDEITLEKDLPPNEILDQLSERIVSTLKQKGNSGENKDGMDIVLCCYDKKTQQLSFAAANNSLYVMRNSVLTEYKPDKQPCGFHHNFKPFSLQHIQLEKNDIVYTFTDGYADQFGGPKGKKFKYKQLEELLTQSSDKVLSQQKTIIDNSLISWKADLEQVDDVLVIGIKI